MPHPERFQPGPILHFGLLVLVCGLASAALAEGGVQWRLEAQVPVMCTILDVDDQPTGLAIATSCNAVRYRLVLHDPAGQTRLRGARSSAGPVAISGNAVTIMSAQPGYAVTMVELSAPTIPGQVTVTLQPG